MYLASPGSQWTSGAGAPCAATIWLDGCGPAAGAGAPVPQAARTSAKAKRIDVASERVSAGRSFHELQVARSLRAGRFFLRLRGRHLRRSGIAAGGEHVLGDVLRP